MVNEIFKRPYRVRRAAATGMEITVPSGTAFKPGDVVIAFYDGFILYVAKGIQVDEALLRQAITERPEAVQNDEKAGKSLPDTPEGESA